jgi:pimeloyl-ACP methyl ester carboxylesterase
MRASGTRESTGGQDALVFPAQRAPRLRRPAGSVWPPVEHAGWGALFCTSPQLLLLTICLTARDLTQAVGQVDLSTEIEMITLRKKVAVAFLLALSGTLVQAQTKPVAKDIVIVHGALVDGSGWRAVHDILVKDGFHVTIVQEPLTGLADDVDATKRVLDQQTGPVVLVGHSYGGSVITEAGADPKVSALVYVSALQPDVGEASGQLMSKFAAPNDAMRATPDKYFYLPAAQFHATYAEDLSASQAKFLADSEQPLAQKAMATPLTVAAWHSKPSYAILTTDDHMISPQLQRWMYQRAGSKVTELAASHASFMSQPTAVAHVIETAAKQS